MLDRVRDVLYRAIATPRGDAFVPLRVPKDLARRLNATLGRPLAPLDELAKRAGARDRLAKLRAATATASPPAASSAAVAPLLVYFERDSNVRELTRIEELLGTKGYEWKRLDVSGDESTLDFVVRTAHCERDDLPVVFVADRVIGGYDALVRCDVSGELERLVRPS